MQITIIVATGLERQIGLKGKIPWRVPEDLQNFKKVTLGHHVLMGRKTFESLGKPLPGRTNIVISSKMEPREDIKVFPSIEEGAAFAKSQGETELFICGGSKIYEDSLPLATFMYLTQVDYSGEADAYFPVFESSEWEPVMKTSEHTSVSGTKWCLLGLRRIPS